MHVVIIGAGEVGGYLAERLRSEGLDVVVIETDPIRASAIGADLDVQVINGSGSNPSVLIEAGIGRADLLAAVTQNDEVNLIASLLAKQHGVKTTVVRVVSDAMRGKDAVALLSAVGADVVVDPDAETADEILELVHTTGADEVYPMSNGELVVIGAFVSDNAPLANRSLEEIGRSLGEEWDFLFGAITRNGDTVIPRGAQMLLPGDHVRVLSRASAQSDLLRLLGVANSRARKVMVLGGGAVGSRVAGRLEDEGVEVVLIERDEDRASDLSKSFRRTMVVRGDVTDTELLLEEGVGDMDAVVAATGEDASNVLACAYAIAEGAKFTVAVLHRLALLPLVRRFGIDAALSPRTASANSVLRAVRGDTTAVTTFLEGDSEVDELEISVGSKADGAVVADLPLPKNILIGAVVRAGEQARIVRGRTRLQAGDHIIVFGRPNALAAVRPLFRT
ncbi:MAG: Trk system potassium transporter TrkA [Acidimicrobiales bacterium]